MKTSRIAIATGACLLVCGLAAPPAQALTEWDYCSADGDVLTAGTTYVASGTRWYVSKHQMTIDNDADQNNLRARLRHRDNAPIYWAYTSGDNIDGGQTYVKLPQTTVPKPAEMYTGATMEQFLDDPSCYTLIQLDGVDQ